MTEYFKLTPISDPPKEDGPYTICRLHNGIPIGHSLNEYANGKWVWPSDYGTHYLAPLAGPVEGIFSETMLNHVWVGARLRMNGSCVDHCKSIYRYSFEEWLRYAEYARPDLFKYNHDDYVPKFKDWADEEGWEEFTNGVWVRNSCLGDKDFSEESSRDDLFRMYLKDLPRLIHPEKASSAPHKEPVEGMRWVKASKRLPEKEGSYYCKNKPITNDEVYNNIVHFNSGRFQTGHSVIEWLDESASSAPSAREELERFRNYTKQLIEIIERFKYGESSSIFDAVSSFKQQHNL